MRITLPDFATKAINILNSHGYRAYAVGGCVRDAIRGVSPSDWDICTSARPDQIIEAFSEFKVLETGIKHGTVTVMFDKVSVEITTFRIDGEYKDNRHPEKVIFTDILELDLSRRDFTINAMAYSPDHGLIDPFGGKSDLESGIIRCVGESEIRFEEDALRILRALRFSSIIGYKIENATADAISKKAHLLGNIAPERINAELKKLLCGDNVKDVLTKFREVIGEIIPELIPTFDFDQKTKYHIYDVWQHTLHSLENISNDPVSRFTMLLHDAGKPHCFTQDDDGVGHFFGHPEKSEQIAFEVLSRLKLDKKTINDVCTLVKYHDADVFSDERSILKWLNLIGEDLFIKLVEVKRADNLAQSPRYSYADEFSRIEELYNRMKTQPICYKIKHLAVSGNDLIEIGINDGREIGNSLNMLLDAVINGKVKNDRKKLLEYVKRSS